MTVLPFALSARRVLVVTPTKLLRSQIGSEFASLHVLRSTGVVPEAFIPPSVREVASRLSDASMWSDLLRFDVVIGTPNVLSPAIAGVAAPPDDLFDLIVFDEAHHTPAQTYGAILSAFPVARAVLFTATPFRRDRQPLPGTPAYSYGLAQALDEEILAPIRFLPVDVPAGADEATRDRTLAQAAKARLESPEHVQADSRIIARTSSVEHAKSLIDVYRATGVDLGLITASTSSSAVRKLLAAARDGDLGGLISVGVLGEGFDFPTLKIGVYHRRHASLPATLQFLGRISRTVITQVPGELLAIREDVSDETRELYASDVAWATLVPALADAAIENEAERRSYVRSFDPIPNDPLSLAAVRVRKDVQVFQLDVHSQVNLDGPLKALGGGEVIYHGHDSDEDLAVVITEHLERPEWLDADTLDRFGFELHVLVYDRAHSLLFAHGVGDKTIQELLCSIGLDSAQLVDPIWMDRLLSSLAIADYHSVGMRSARAAGGRLAAYRMMAGTSVGSAVLPSETRSYGAGHAIARVRDPMSTTAADVIAGTAPVAAVTSLGVSYGRAKVFSPDLVDLLEFKRWCLRLAELVDAQREAQPSGPPALALRSPRGMSEFPAQPYVAVLEPHLIGRGYYLVNVQTGQSANLEELELDVEPSAPTRLRLRGSLDGAEAWTADIDTHGVISGAQTWDARDSRGDPTPLADFLTMNPVTIFYASGASSIGRVVFQPRTDYPDLPPGMLEGWSFDGTDLRAEHTGARAGLRTIKDFVVATAAPSAEFIIDDDRSGEVADLVVIRAAEPDGQVPISLLHMKGSREPPGARVDDLYEVLGQAARSVVWCAPDRMAERLLKRLQSGSCVMHGDPVSAVSTLEEWIAHPPPVRWSIGIVQPGLKIAGVAGSNNVRTILNDYLEWITQHDVAALVFGHL